MLWPTPFPLDDPKTPLVGHVVVHAAVDEGHARRTCGFRAAVHEAMPRRPQPTGWEGTRQSRGRLHRHVQGQVARRPPPESIRAHERPGEVDVLPRMKVRRTDGVIHRRRDRGQLCRTSLRGEECSGERSRSHQAPQAGHDAEDHEPHDKGEHSVPDLPRQEPDADDGGEEDQEKKGEVSERQRRRWKQGPLRRESPRQRTHRRTELTRLHGAKVDALRDEAVRERPAGDRGDRRDIAAPIRIDEVEQRAETEQRGPMAATRNRDPDLRHV